MHHFDVKVARRGTCAGKSLSRKMAQRRRQTSEPQPHPVPARYGTLKPQPATLQPRHIGAPNPSECRRPARNDVSQCWMTPQVAASCCPGRERASATAMGCAKSHKFCSLQLQSPYTTNASRPSCPVATREASTEFARGSELKGAPMRRVGQRCNTSSGALRQCFTESLASLVRTKCIANMDGSLTDNRTHHPRRC